VDAGASSRGVLPGRGDGAPLLGADWLDTAVYPVPEVPDLERLHEVQAPTFVLSGQEDLHDFVEIANMLAWWIRVHVRSRCWAWVTSRCWRTVRDQPLPAGFLRKVAAEKEI